MMGLLIEPLDELFQGMSPSIFDHKLRTTFARVILQTNYGGVYSQLSCCKASKLSGKRKLCLYLQDLLYMQGGLPPALKGSDRIRSVGGYNRKK